MGKPKFKEWLTQDGLTRIEGWARSGLSDEQISHNMGITTSTFYAWENKFSEITEAIKKGKAPVDIAVENALLKSALGYTVKVKKAVKIREERQKVGEGKIVTERIEYVDEEVYIPPSNAAQIFWLKNRMPDRWRDKPVDPGNGDEKVTVVIDV